MNSSSLRVPFLRVPLWWVLLLCLLLVGLYIRFVFLSTALSNLGVNGDEALSFLQARYIAENNFPLFFWTQPYQFPFEAYILSYLVEYLPWNTFGARIVQVSLCLIAVPGFLLVLLRHAPSKAVWPGIALILLPSSYWLIRQVGLMTPQHAVTVSFAWILPGIVLIAQQSTYPWWWSFLGALAAGMALSNHLLSLSLILPCSAALCLSTDFKKAWRCSLAFIPGFLVGAAPYLYAKCCVPGAYQTVAATRPISDAIGRFWHPVITRVVPSALGIVPTYIGDTLDTVRTFRVLLEPIGALFLLLLVSLTVMRVRDLYLRSIRDLWLSIEIEDVFIGTTWLALILLCETGMDLRTRYALPIVWCFPFLIAFAYARSGRILRSILSAITVLLLVINLHTSTLLISVWKKPNFSQTHGVLPDLQPLFSYFEREGITHCYAGWWLAYRIVFESQEKIICSPPFNDRFRAWPQPYYRKLVDAAQHAPYVEGRYLHYLLRGDLFTKYLAHHKITMDTIQLGELRVYDNFRHTDVTNSHALRTPQLRVNTSDNPAQSAALIDSSLQSAWRSVIPQKAGMKITLSWDTARTLHGVLVYALDEYYEKHPPRVNIEALDENGRWQLVSKNNVGHPHLLRLIDASSLDASSQEHFPGLELMFGFTPVRATAIKISILHANPTRHWHLAEIVPIVQEATSANDW